LQAKGRAPLGGEIKGMEWYKFAQHGQFPVAGPYVDGRLVRDHVPNTSSIDASVLHPEVLPGIREVPMAAFTLDEAPLATDESTVVSEIGEQ